VICLKRFFSLLLIVSLVLFSSCGSRYDSFDPPESDTTATPSGWITLGRGARLEDIKEVHPEKMPARHIELPDAFSGALLGPLSDGGCLAVSGTPIGDDGTKSDTLHDLRAIRFASDGSVLWDRTYTNDSFKGYAASICIFPDDGYALLLNISGSGSGSVGQADRIYRFLPDGNLSWRSDDEEISTDRIDGIFAAPDGALLAAGTTSENNLYGTNGGDDTVILRFEKDGRLSKRQLIDNEGITYLEDSSYMAGTGLILIWKDRAMCFGDDLEEKWTLKMAAGESLYEVEALPDGTGAIVSGSLPADPDIQYSNSTREAVFLIDDKGIIMQIYAETGSGIWLNTSAKVSDGRFIICKHIKSDDGREKCELIIVSADGSCQTSLGMIPGIIQQIVPTKDGGFTVISRHIAKYLPQPSSDSYILTDTEVIIAHYDSNPKLVWKRRIDQYKDVKRWDIVVPTSDDRLLIG
jgi:hypothetical protein